MDIPGKLLVVAKAAAQAAAEVHYRMKNSRLEVHTKGSSMELVTVVDREAEQELVSVIRGARPHDTIIIVVAANPKLLKAMVEVLIRAGVIETGALDGRR
jgi:3'-phosphoadenosine 5'-phosphosulfate (PAPS) 3'-phosphatase